ncbi:MAG: Stk1 family PASTA domain-containing Ser/Thr kinase [Coriobacteriia bacterium]|nr:Stk1 family PASTA domain-containing Ser/Thr kinase [Coriobacteriia bacterium]
MEELVFGRRYRVIEKIGTGGMADVYKAVDEVLGRTVAVKVMHPRYASDPSFAARFRQEAQAAANLVSPNIVNMYDWGADGDTYYMVMEYVRGSDLKSIIQQKGSLASAKVADIGAQVCAALSVAHGYDIIHRDIKPHNIMVQPDGSVKVMDFGIARAGNSTMTQTGSVLGTAHYVSPEQAQGKELHATSDLYSLGIVLYEASTGQLPFDADTPVAVALKQVNEQPKPPRAVRPDVDPALEAIIVKAMQKNPALRYPSADEMRRDLQAVAQGRVPTGVEIAGAAAAGAAMAAGADASQTSVMPTVGGPTRAASRQAAPKKRPMWPWLLVVLALIVAGFGVAWAAGVFAPSTVAVTDITLMTQSEATLALQTHGLVATTTPTQAYSDTVPQGKIISQSPVAGTVVPKGTSVGFVISQGPAPVQVPNVVGLQDSDASAKLAAAGLVPVSGGSQFDAKAPLGQVLSQTPAALTKQPRGTQVTYITSKGQQMGTVPDVTSMSRSDAEAAITKAGFKYSTSTAFSDTVDSGNVISQDPSGGGSYPSSKTIKLVISKGSSAFSMIDLTNLTLSAAKTALSNKNLQLGSVTYTPKGDTTTDPNYVPSNRVYLQNPLAGVKVKPGDSVDITIDGNPPP